MIKNCYIDGCEFVRDDFPEGLYVYQTVITFGHRALYLRSYLALLREASESMLGSPLPISEKQADLQISLLLRKNNYPVAMYASVEMRFYRSGEFVLLGGDVSPYPKWGLRMLRPAATSVVYDLPFSEHRSLLSRSAAEIAKVNVKSRGAEAVVRVGVDGMVRSVEDAEIFVVKEYTVMTPALPRTVEGRLLVDAIRRSGLRLEYVSVPFESLEYADEIFYADHLGVTALDSFNGQPMMHILTEKIANLLK